MVTPPCSRAMTPAGGLHPEKSATWTISEHFSLYIVHDEDKDQRANAGRTFSGFRETLRTRHSAVPKKMLCSKENQLDRGKMLGNRCGSENDTAHVTQTHGNIKSRMRNLNVMRSKREQNNFFWGKQSNAEVLAWQSKWIPTGERNKSTTECEHHKWSEM